MLRFVLFVVLVAFSASLGQDEFTIKGIGSFGGYGELHYNYVKPDDKEVSKTLDFHRFVLFYGHTWNESWSFKAEVELEHNYVKDGNGELELEQAYVQYHHNDMFKIQAGVVLPSAGLLNELHEPPLFLSVERPDYHKNIIPTTWFGNGLSVLGAYKGFDYKLTIMEGLNADKFSASSGLRGGRQKGYKADAENLLYNFRVDFKGIHGLKVGTSFSYNEAKSEVAENIDISLIEVHAKYYSKGIYAVAEFGNVSYGAGDIESSLGFYADFGYNIARLFKMKSEIIPFIRYSDINTANSTRSGGDSELKYHHTKFMFGVAYLPIPEVAIKADYSTDTVELGDYKTEYINLGIGYMF